MSFAFIRSPVLPVHDKKKPGRLPASSEALGGLVALQRRLLQRRKKAAPLHLINTHTISKTLNTTGAFIFLFHRNEVENTAPAPTPAQKHDQIMRDQAFSLACHVREIGRLLAIDDLYAHPLVRRQEILSGHCMTAFIGAPVRCETAQVLAVVCAIDAKARKWNSCDISRLERIVAQIESCPVWLSKICGTR